MKKIHTFRSTLENEMHFFLDKAFKFSYIVASEPTSVKDTRTHISLFYCICCLLLLVPFSGNSQDWVDQHNNILDRDLEININAGTTSYYGDLSMYDNSFSDKLSHESGLAFGMILTKKLTPQIGVSGQIIWGQVHSQKNNVSFESSIFEYNLHVRLNMIHLFSSNYKSKLNWELFFGFGNFLFNSTKTEYLEGENIITEHSTRVPELVFFGGTGLNYRFNDQLSCGVEMSIHQFQNDMIDVTVENGDFDYFTYLSVGVTYHLKAFTKSAPRNKARIAHNSKRRMKPLEVNR